MRRVRALVGGYALLVALCAPAVLSASESDDPATSGGAVIAPASGGDEGGASAAKQATHDVAMRDYKFVPKEITVDVGDTVTWTNEDSADHNAVADDGSFKTPTFGEGETASVTIEEAGSFPYVCTLHSNMEGRISTTGSEPTDEEGGSGDDDGGGGSSGASGSGSASGDDPLVPGGSGTGTDTGSGTSGSSGSSADSSLPLTGSDSVWLAIAGAWLLAVGAAVRLAVARRT